MAHGWNHGKLMNFFKKIASSLTVRGRALTQVSLGRACAAKHKSEEAIKHYTNVINLANSPRDVIAMALFNRALVYNTIGKQRQATADLKAVLNMPEAITTIKKSATDKLVRMERKRTRDKTP
jgi:tetratricopeptide (TPR) repeat protein